MHQEETTAPVRQPLAAQFVTTIKLLTIMAGLGLGLWLLDRWLVG